jgi:hypothetical protein
MPLEYVPGSASLNPLFQEIKGSREPFEELKENYQGFIRSLGGIDIHQQHLSDRLDGYIREVKDNIQDINDAFVELINVTATPSIVLRSLISSTIELVNSLSELRKFIVQVISSEDLEDFDWRVEKETMQFLKLLKRIRRRNMSQDNRTRGASRKASRTPSRSHSRKVSRIAYGNRRSNNSARRRMK